MVLLSREEHATGMHVSLVHRELGEIGQFVQRWDATADLLDDGCNQVGCGMAQVWREYFVFQECRGTVVSHYIYRGIRSQSGKYIIIRSILTFRSVDNDEEDSENYTLTFNIDFQYDNDTVYFAHSYPYTYSDLQVRRRIYTFDYYRNNTAYIYFKWSRGRGD